METGPPLSQGLDDRVLPPLSEGLDLPLYNNIATLTCASKAFACLVVLIEGKFYDILTLKIFSSISFVLLQRMQQNIKLWLSVV